MNKISKKNYGLPIILIGISFYKNHMPILIISTLVFIIILLYNTFGGKLEKYKKFSLYKGNYKNAP